MDMDFNPSSEPSSSGPYIPDAGECMRCGQMCQRLSDLSPVSDPCAPAGIHAAQADRIVSRHFGYAVFLNVGREKLTHPLQILADQLPGE